MTGPELLREWMAKHELDGLDVARRVDASKSTVSLWLAGKRAPSLEFALRVSDATSGFVPVSAWVKGRRDHRTG